MHTSWKRTLPGVRIAALALALGLATALSSCDGSSTDPYGGGQDGTAIVATVTQDGAPASGLTVSLYESGGATSLESATTDTDGQARFTELDAGTYDVEVAVPTGYMVSGGTARQSVTVSDGGEATVAFPLVSESLPEPTDTVEVQAVNHEFTPADLTIAPNTLVRWVNTTGTRHTVTPDGHDEWVDTDLPDMGATFEHVFRTEGSFPYYCTPHRSLGMVGSVTVQAP